MRLNTWMKFADLAAMTMSQARTRLQPAPAATPLTAQITGKESARNCLSSGL